MISCSETLTEEDLKEGVHLSGIGGVGMTALAEMLLDAGIEVSGSDTTYSANVQKLKALGIPIYDNHDKDRIGNRLVCRTRAIKDDNEEVVHAKKAVYRSTLLRLLAKDKRQLVVTGSHGKTTTSALLVHCMVECGFDVSFAVGGFCPNLNRFGKLTDGEYFVIEGDESDGSHLKTDPYGGILTSADVDHLAFWKKGGNLLSSYKKFAENMGSCKNFIYNGDDKEIQKMDLLGQSFGRGAHHDYFPEEVTLEYLRSTFTIDNLSVELPMFGEYNIYNAVAVFALLDSLGVNREKIVEAFASFKGILRRMEFLGKNIYSDYAHHPEEVECVLKSLDKISNDVRVIFEPHRLSRFRDEMDGFCSIFHDVIITDIFEASEGLDIPSKPLLDEFCIRTNSKYVPLDEIETYLKREKRDILALGAGPLDQRLRNFVKGAM